jgi:peptidoglycan/LPS O-acetylase OafA/YrhL
MPKAVAEIAGSLGLISIVTSFVALSSADAFPGIAAIPACVGTAAVIASALAHPTVVSRCLGWKPIVLIGLISYSLYLWHWPLIALYSYRMERPLDASEAGAIVLLSMALAYLSWRFVERPFRARHTSSREPAVANADRNFA